MTTIEDLKKKIKTGQFDKPETILYDGELFLVPPDGMRFFCPHCLASLPAGADLRPIRLRASTYCQHHANGKCPQLFHQEKQAPVIVQMSTAMVCTNAL